MRNTENLIDPALDGITNRSHSRFTFEDFRLVNDSSLSLKFKFDFEQLRLISLFRVDLLI